MLKQLFSTSLRHAAYASGVAMLLAAGAAQAGDYMMPMPPAPQPEFCFDQNLRSFDVYGGYKATQFDDSKKDDESGWGGGIGVNLYFNRYVGFGAEGNFFSNDSEVDFSTAGNLLLRIPIDSICLAPYGLIGAGYDFADEAGFFWQAGVGVEWKMNNYVGLFGDARAIFPNHDEEDSQMYRAGLRFNF